MNSFVPGYNFTMMAGRPLPLSSTRVEYMIIRRCLADDLEPARTCR